MTSRKRGYFLVTKVDSYMGSSRAFSGSGICHFFRRDIGKLDFRIVGKGIKYTHDTGNILIFLHGTRER